MFFSSGQFQNVLKVEDIKWHIDDISQFLGLSLIVDFLVIFLGLSFFYFLHSNIFSVFRGFTIWRFSGQDNFRVAREHSEKKKFERFSI